MQGSRFPANEQKAGATIEHVGLLKGFAAARGARLAATTAVIAAALAGAALLPAAADAAALGVTLVSPGPSQAVGTVMTASATVSGDGVTKVEFWVDDEEQPKATDLSAPYSAYISMGGYPDGSPHIVKAIAYNSAGDTAEDEAAVLVDKHVTLTAGSVPAFTNAETVPIEISTDPDAGIKCRLNSGSVTPCSGTYSPIDATSPDGAYTYQVVATDAVGNTASVTRSFVLDRTLPVIDSFTAPSDGAVLSTKTVTVEFGVSDENLDAVACSIDGATGACTSDTSDVLTDLADGPHTFTLHAADKAGNEATETRTFSVDTTPDQANPPAGATPTGNPSPGGSRPSGQTRQIKLSQRWRVRSRGTQVRKLLVRSLPAGARLKVLCRGHGCPFKAKRLKARHGRANLTPLFRHRFLRPRARIVIRVLVPGAKAKSLVLKVRARKPPRLTRR